MIRRRVVQAGVVAVAVVALGVAVAATPVARAVGAGGRALERGWLVATGGLVDVGGYRLRLDCQGAHGMTVVLEGGLCQTRQTWGSLAGAVAKFARVCAYDRAGLGRSDPGPPPRSGERAVAELHTLLRTAGVSPPYVLVGHSFGGLLVRLYASRHPTEIAGLVLVDASHEDQYGRLAALMEPRERADYLEHEGGRNCEALDLVATGAALRGRPLPPVPLAALSARPRWPTGECAESETRRELQMALAGLTPGARQIVAERSGHFIQRDRPEVVIDAIRQVVEAARAAR